MLLNKKEKIISWLNESLITHYNLIEDEKYGYLINVNNHVNLWNNNLKNIQIKFNQINGYFNCGNNQLTSLEGCPKAINEIFNCNENQLTSLKVCPKIIRDYFYCSKNLLNIQGLKYLPEMIYSNSLHIVNNTQLDFFQNINDFNVLKNKLEEIFKIQAEKENLDKLIEKTNKKEIIKNKVNKI